MSNESALARSTVLAPLGRGGRAEEVVQRISESISLGLLVDGEQLPSETDLSAMLGVSTVTLREALASLRQQGLIETRRGRNGGSFVRSAAGPTKAALERRLAAFTVSQLRDAGDELTAISGAAARLASSRASNDSIRRLSVLAQRLLTANGAAQRARTDSRFHIEVAVAATSERLTRHEAALQAELGSLLWWPDSTDLQVEQAVAEHVAIAQAIHREDAALARDLAQQHVNGNTQRLIERRIRLGER
ncbi:MAG: FadR family transcriptional regulator [Actinobacteria bacterium]|nr:FadR family transcriptional regulator [Actinomycetota bacterium]MCO5298669.1 GntR family transcriptional regulator [Candidatus Nanopelagicales bacterium]MCB9429002.1 FadR family transcriptional regulator [Actinomycetota bacterium]HPE12788.1 GntR family transcriptional regulator [Actinomycetota bacterium]HPQ85319.1 GntR family transcriptional regulator [Actinomycetota bacterium]